MAANTRTKAQVQSDRIEVVSLYLQGKWQHEIAELVGRSQEMISYDLRAVKKQWREAPQAELNEIKVKQLAKIDELEREYWEAWHNSKKPKDITRLYRDSREVFGGKCLKRLLVMSYSPGGARYLKWFQLQHFTFFS